MVLFVKRFIFRGFFLQSNRYIFRFMRFLCYLSLAQAFHLAEQQSLIALCSLVEKVGSQRK
nr:MAG TPA: hypothetical protein [Bacteriophage sp.]